MVLRNRVHISGIRGVDRIALHFDLLICFCAHGVHDAEGFPRRTPKYRYSHEIDLIFFLLRPSSVTSGIVKIVPRQDIGGSEKELFVPVWL